MLNRDTFAQKLNRKAVFEGPRKSSSGGLLFALDRPSQHN